MSPPTTKRCSGAVVAQRAAAAVVGQAEAGGALDGGGGAAPGAGAGGVEALEPCVAAEKEKRARKGGCRNDQWMAGLQGATSLPKQQRQTRPPMATVTR